MECSCSISSGSAECEFDDILSRKLIKSKSVHKCGECGRNIPAGELYELYRAVFDGQQCRYKTCRDCLSFRENFFDDFMFESLWEHFEDHMDECGWQVPEACLSRVTPRTRSKICEKIETYWEDEDD